MMDVAGRIAALSSTGEQPELPGPELLPTRLMRACAQVLPVDGAGISFFSGFRHRVPLGASDDDAVLAERLQFTVGEGPCLTAHAEDGAVMATADTMGKRWPIFYRELLARTPYRAILSLPVTTEEFGGDAAVDLYYADPRPDISESALNDVKKAIDIIGALLVANSGLGDSPKAEPVWCANDAVRSRSQVWIAMGMINVALGLDPIDSLAVLRGYAFGHGTTVDDIARHVTARQLPVEALGVRRW